MTLSNLDDLAVSANAFCSAHGIQVERSDGSYRSAPVSLLPNAYPKPAFDQAISFAQGFNTLVDRISRDSDFLIQTLGGSVASADPFTAKLLQLYKEVYVQEKTPAAVSADRLGIHRSDYMLHPSRTNDEEDEASSLRYVIKQVELNTIAASFAGLSCQVAAMHQFLAQRFESDELNEVMATNQKAVGGTCSNPHVPTNPTLERLPFAMSLAVKRYRERFNINDASHDNKVVVLFVVQDGETNTVDQRLLEFRLFQNHGIPVLRASLATIHAHGQLSKDDDDDNDGKLVLFGKEVALVYFRAGYAPTDYVPEDEAWQARKTLEQCRAAKCPSLGYHLAGTKKVQQELARPGVLERFVTDDVLRDGFAGLYSLGDDATEGDLAAVRQVLDGHASRYVLKPQREGGGYNYYGDRLFEKIKANVKLNDDGSLTLNESLGEYILMERLFPPQQTAILLRDGKVEGSGDSVSELGCFGTILSNAEGEIIHNEYAGFLLRTKFSNVDEGGVASGFATLSSPYLC